MQGGGLIVHKRQIQDILNGARNTVILPVAPDQNRVQTIKRKGGPIIARCRITAIEPVELETLTDEDARRAGFSTVDEWMTDYFEVYKGTPGLAWTGTTACLVSFRLVPAKEQVRLLSSQQGARFTEGTARSSPGGLYPTDHAGQYTSSTARALPSEPEAVRPEDIERFSLEARQRRAKADAARVAWYRERSLADQLRAIQEDERLSRMARDDLKVIARRVQAIWDRGDKGKAA
jgi:hypothetical protein